MNSTLLTVFVGLSTLAIVIQMGILIALYVSAKETGARLQSLSKKMEEDLVPLIQEARAVLADSGPKIRETVDNLTAISVVLHQQTERINLALNDVVDRARLQVKRADEMVGRAFDRVEETTETIQRVVASPMGKINAVMTGVMAGLGEFLGNRKVQRQKKAVPRDEMFI